MMTDIVVLQLIFEQWPVAEKRALRQLKLQEVESYDGFNSMHAYHGSHQHCGKAIPILIIT